MTDEEISKLRWKEQLDTQLAVFKDEADKLIAQKITEYKQKLSASAKPEEHKKGKSLNDYLAHINGYTSNASSVNRNLALGGIGIIWIFKRNETTHVIDWTLLNFPLVLLAASLALDLLQYLFGAVAWKIFYERKYWVWKNRKNYDSAYACDIEAPNWISAPIYVLWLLKILFMGAAYFFIIQFLVKQL